MTSPTASDIRVLTVPAFVSSTTTPIVIPVLAPPTPTGVDAWRVDGSYCNVLWTDSWSYDDFAGPPLKYRLHRLSSDVEDDSNIISIGALNAFTRSFTAYTTDRSLSGQIDVGYNDVMIVRVEHQASATTVTMPPSLLTVGYYIP